MSDPRTADSLRASAGDFFARATELEAQNGAAAQPGLQVSSNQTEKP